VIPARPFWVSSSLEAIVTNLPRVPEICFKIVSIFVWVNKLVSRVVGWVDIDHLDLVRITLLKQLQDFKVIALDKQVLGRIPINTLFRAR